jgi:GR25 family glycosyltransferase involved in LPS biosynthesis
MSIQYYLIHGIDSSRKQRMINEFKKGNINESAVKWILWPNRDEITPDLYKKIVIQEDSYSNGIFTPGGKLGLGRTACSYKHYLALKDIIENNYDYGVIMEDNMQFAGNVSERVLLYIKQLNELYPNNWDVLFDLNYRAYYEGPLKDGVYVYPKSNRLESNWHGSTRCAQFYLVTNKCAKELYENYLPFNNAPDFWMNDLFRKLSIKSFWAEPPIVHTWSHISTAD